MKQYFSMSSSTDDYVNDGHDDYRTNLACVYMRDWLEVISE